MNLVMVSSLLSDSRARGIDHRVMRRSGGDESVVWDPDSVRFLPGAWAGIYLWTSV